MLEFAVGVDLGGTLTKLVLIDTGGKILLRSSTTTLRDDSSPTPVIEALIGVTSSFIDRCESSGYPVSGIGFALPFYHDGPEWTLLQTNNLPSLEGFPLRKALNPVFGDSIAAINDVCAAAISEYMFGKGQDVERMLFMAIGTGISVSFITREQGLVHFTWDAAGDSGQIIVDPYDAQLCPCGGRGCLEAYAAAPAIRRQAIQAVQHELSVSYLGLLYKQKGDLDAADVSLAAASGDPTAMTILENVGRYIGVALTSYLHIFAPTMILIGGGVSQAGDLILVPARKELERLANPWYFRRLTGLDISGLGTDASAIGSASLVLFPGKYYQGD